MTKLLEQALEAVRELSDEEQNTVASALIDYANRDGELRLTEEQAAEIERRMNADDQRFITLEELEARLDRMA